MQNNDLSYLKRHLLQLLEMTTNKSRGRNQFNCIKCGSGQHSHGTGAFTYYPSTDTFYCFACNWSGDIFDYYEYLHKVDFITAKKELEELFNEQPINTPRRQNYTAEPKKTTYKTAQFNSQPNNQPKYKTIKERNKELKEFLRRREAYNMAKNKVENKRQQEESENNLKLETTEKTAVFKEKTSIPTQKESEINTLKAIFGEDIQ